jgi:mannose-6-phosphate isomerase-like protein (cupin superfamily)
VSRMRVTRYDDAPGYPAALHRDVEARRLQGFEAGDTTHFWIGLSNYLPGGCAEEAPTREETVYVVLAGALDLTCGDETIRLGQYDSVHLAKGEVRRIDNRGGEPALLLVTIALPHGG